MALLHLATVTVVAALLLIALWCTHRSLAILATHGAYGRKIHVNLSTRHDVDVTDD